MLRNIECYDSLKPNDSYASVCTLGTIGLDNGLLPILCQAIISEPMSDYCSLDYWENISVEF